jgi:hypothetical protein
LLQPLQGAYALARLAEGKVQNRAISQRFLLLYERQVNRLSQNLK